MKNKYTTPAIQIFKLDVQQFIMAGSATAPNEIEKNDDVGSKEQLGKHHSLFDDNEENDEW